MKELRLAEQVQRSMLPRVLPKLPTLEFGASLRPTQHLAGDFYNVIRLDRDRVGFYLGDVMGHGPAAALLGVFAMQGLRTKIINGSTYEILSPAAVLAGLSRDLIQADFPESPFVTMIYAVVDTSQHSLVYSCGGHPPAILMRLHEAPRLLDCRSPLLGVFDVPFEQAEIALEPGDRVAIFSDGVESIIWGDFGEGVKGLIKALEIRDGRSPQELIDAAMALAKPGACPTDDITLVMVESRGQRSLQVPLPCDATRLGSEPTEPSSTQGDTVAQGVVKAPCGAV
jgi:serine phosphatase RsbU (regulator of sigma subunit)